ncbi:MAG: DUF1572 family protein [Gemmatirosa sp.]|nr:DUF1572 family protein [Gemmatirosa sp.]
MIADFIGEYRRYRSLGERALAQASDESLNHVPADDANSIAMIVRHLGGNLASRFSGFLTEDGEKPWRDRDAEFETRPYTRAEIESWWTRGWTVLESELAALTEADATRTVHIRGVGLTVHEALCRSLSHVAYHVGQIVLLARGSAGSGWQSLSIPRGGSAHYNQHPVREKPPA